MGSVIVEPNFVGDVARESFRRRIGYQGGTGRDWLCGTVVDRFVAEFCPVGTGEDRAVAGFGSDGTLCPLRRYPR